LALGRRRGGPRAAADVDAATVKCDIVERTIRVC